jgi:hypothetical protein
MQFTAFAASRPEGRHPSAGIVPFLVLLTFLGEAPKMQERGAHYGRPSPKPASGARSYNENSPKNALFWSVALQDWSSPTSL